MKRGRTPYEWQRFCQDHGLEFKDRGKSTAKGFIYISCPWCDDGSDHQFMGLNLRETFYGCWKDSEHRGHNPVRLIQALLSVSWAEARLIADEYAPEGLQLFGAVAPTSDVAETPVAYDAPEGVTSEFPAAARQYLSKRGVRVPDFRALGGMFGGVGRAAFAWRVTLPVVNVNGLAIGLTGRHIGDSPLRYYTLPGADPVGLVGTHWCRASSTVLVAVEGPFDALLLQIAALCSGLPIDAVALLGVSPSRARIRQLLLLSQRYETTVCLLDDASYSASIELVSELPGSAFPWLLGGKDPGGRTLEQNMQTLREIFSVYEHNQRARVAG